MQREPAELGKKARAELKAYGGHYLKERLEWLQPYPVGLRLKALLSIQQEDWTALSRLATSYRREALKDLAGMRAQQKAWAHLASDTRALYAAVGNKWTRPDQRPDWDELRKRVVRGLREQGLTEAQAQQGARDFATASAKDLLKVAQEPLTWWAHQLEAGAIPRVSTLAAAEIANAVAHFNKKFSQSGTLDAPEAGVARTASKELESSLKDLRTVLRSGSRKEVAATARRARTEAAQQLEPLARAAAYLARQSARNDSVSTRREALRVADALRLALFVTAAARLVEWKAGWTDESAPLGEWRKAAKSKAFKSAYRAPALARLADVARDPSDYDGKHIALEGIVGPVAVIHRGQKVISASSLSDAAGGVVAVGITHIKLDSGGFVPGSYAFVAGTFRTNTAEFSGPTLVIDRRNLTEDSRASWLDWLTLQMLPVLTVTPNGLCSTSSWQPGADGPGNLLRYGTWASSRRRIF